VPWIEAAWEATLVSHLVFFEPNRHLPMATKSQTTDLEEAEAILSIVDDNDPERAEELLQRAGYPQDVSRALLESAQHLLGSANDWLEDR
jgi:hypothetical protein